jgi:hypothetical protein
VTRGFLPRWVRRLRRRLQALDRLAKLDELDRLAKREEFDRLDGRVDALVEAIGRVEARQLEGIRGPLQDHEFRVYSHSGEDGILQFLTANIETPRKTFVEFGVEDYREANTRYLVANCGWMGLVMDGDPANIKQIRRSPLYWNSNLRAEDAFVTRENVDTLLTDFGFLGDLGLLSVDVDGNDYWVFNAITVVRPRIAVVEYNHRFGPTRSVTIPYDPGFVRRHDDPSWLVCGTSLAAIVKAAHRKGMSLVGCNSFGNNAFLVRDDVKPAWMPALTAEEGFVAGKFRETMVVAGEARPLSYEEEQALIGSATLVEIE